MKERSDYFQVTPTEIGVMKGGRFVTEVNSTHLSENMKYVVMPITWHAASISCEVGVN